MKTNSQIILTKNLIKVFGGHIYSELIYTDNSKNKIPVITVHGGPGSTFCRMKWGLYKLADQFPIICYDQIGGGKSTLIQQDFQQNFNRQSLWTIKNFVNQLQSLIKFYDLKKFILFGTSWGSTLSLQYYFSPQTKPKPFAMYLNSPLINTKVWIQDANILKKGLPPQIYKIMLKYQSQGNTQHPQYQMAINYFNNKHVCKSQLISKQQIQFLNQSGEFNSQVYNYMWGPSQFYCTGTLINYDRIQDIKNIDIPVMFTCGQFDEARPQTVQSFHKKVPNSKFFMFEGCSHTSHFENTKQFQKVFLNFYKQITKDVQNNTNIQSPQTHQ